MNAGVLGKLSKRELESPTNSARISRLTTPNELLAVTSRFAHDKRGSGIGAKRRNSEPATPLGGAGDGGTCGVACSGFETRRPGESAYPPPCLLGSVSFDDKQAGPAARASPKRGKRLRRARHALRSWQR